MVIGTALRICVYCSGSHERGMCLEFGKHELEFV